MTTEPDKLVWAVVGFMFSRDKQSVALIRKQRPAFQAGKLNGIGGKLEMGEARIDAMVREFYEETGVQTAEDDWRSIAVLETPGWCITFYRAFGSLDGLKTMTDEQVEVVKVSELRQAKTMRNLQWMVPLCLDDSPYQLPIHVKETGEVPVRGAKWPPQYDGDECDCGCKVLGVFLLYCEGHKPQEGV